MNNLCHSSISLGFFFESDFRNFAHFAVVKSQKLIFLDPHKNDHVKLYSSLLLHFTAQYKLKNIILKTV